MQFEIKTQRRVVCGFSRRCVFVFVRECVSTEEGSAGASVGFEFGYGGAVAADSGDWSGDCCEYCEVSGKEWSIQAGGRRPRYPRNLEAGLY
jgi:hypothetical protein